MVLLYFRIPFAARQFWAEDGREFFGDALRFGPIRSLGHSEAGYYLFVSRLGGVFASLVPLRDAALAMWLWTALVVAWVAATIAASSRTWLRTWPARIVVALAVVLLPVSGQESIANAANLQFPMLFASLIVLISRPRNRVETINGCVLLVATGLTTPLSAALLPFAIWRAVRERNLRPDAYILSWLGGTVVQWVAIGLTHPSGHPPHRRQCVHDRSSPRGRGLSTESRSIGCLPASRPVAGPGLCSNPVGAGRAAVEARRSERALLLVAVPAFGVALLVGLALNSGATNRYMVFTGLCMVWTVMAGAEVAAESLPRRRSVPSRGRRPPRSCFLVSVVTRWTPTATRRSGPTWSASLDRPGERAAPTLTRVRVRIAPVQAERPDQWSVCSCVVRWAYVSSDVRECCGVPGRAERRDRPRAPRRREGRSAGDR